MAMVEHNCVGWGLNGKSFADLLEDEVTGSDLGDASCFSCVKALSADAIDRMTAVLLGKYIRLPTQKRGNRRRFDGGT